jgi:hypothetical protein
LTIPTIEQFLEISDPDDFENLEGDHGKPLSDVGLLPNSHWIHPAICVVLNGAKTIKATKAAIIIIRVLKSESDPDDEDEDKNRPVSQMAWSR